ncbi:MAG: M48 family metalloprotease [Fibromonadaceae bacterium]|jgi:predicted Zn-dependent protease|nr:M48 family metalloprotease [Fibromonadaceae bacterium]
MSNKWKFFWVVSFALVLFFQACGMHSWEELLVSAADEKKMGREFDSLVRDKNKDVMSSGEELFSPQNDAQQELYDYYRARGKEIVKVIDKKDMETLLPKEKLCRNNTDNRNEKVACTKDNFFEFKIIKSKQLNAFAVPGGYVYFYTEILKENNTNKNGFRSESELMSVLGHEVGHVVLHHSRESIVKQAALAGVIDALLGDGIGSVLAQLGANFWLLGNSRENESEADVKGFEYTNKIGISSEGLSDFFSRGLKSYNPATGQCDEKKEGSVMDAFSTHPPSCSRVNDNKRRMEKAHQNFPKDRSERKFTDIVKAAGI